MLTVYAETRESLHVKTFKEDIVMSRKFIVLFWLNGKQIRKKFDTERDAVEYASSVKRADHDVGVYDNHFNIMHQFYVR